MKRFFAISFFLILCIVIAILSIIPVWLLSDRFFCYFTTNGTRALGHCNWPLIGVVYGSFFVIFTGILFYLFYVNKSVKQFLSKRKTLAILVGTLSSVPLYVVLKSLPFLTALNTSKGEFTLSLSMFLSGLIAGYLARERGWLYGAFVPLVLYLVEIFFIAVMFSGLLLPSLYEAYIRDGLQYTSLATINWADINVSLLAGFLKIVISVTITSGLGGVVGEYLYRRLRRKN